MTTIDPDHLAAACGGMRWEHMRESTNIEDRRGMSPRESMRVRTPPAPPLPKLERSPGDLPSQLGLDHIDDFVRRQRRRR